MQHGPTFVGCQLDRPQESDTDREPEDRLSADVVAALFEQHAIDLRSFLAGVLRDRHLAEEVLQTVFHRVAELGHTVRGEFRGWLFRVAYNEAMQVRRRQTRERAALGKAVWLQPRVVADESDSAAIRDETVEEVRRAIGSLPEGQQDVVRLRIYEDLKFAEIAERLNLPLGTVLTRMRLANERLQRALKKPTD